jgi:hypothetical protein
MPKQVIIENDFITLWFHPDKKIVHHQFHKKTINSEVLREALNTGAQLLKDHSACKWLSDDRSYVIMSQEDAKWATNIWTPIVIGNGWKYWAILKPADQIGKMSIEQISYDYKQQGITVDFFDNEEKAIEWLDSFKTD